MTTPHKTIGLSVTLNTGMEEAEARVIEALKEQGFGILTEIDITATFKKKLNVDFPPYKILGACNPKLAHRALTLAGEVGLLLPCNVTLSQEDTNQVKVSFVDPLQMLDVVDNPDVRPIADEAREKLEHALNSLQ